MSVFKCKMCGGDLVLEQGQTVAECEYCGSRQTVPAADDEKKLKLFDRAGRLLRNCEFDKAAGVFESVVAENPQEAEAYWGLLLCRYGIEYVDDPATGKKVPTCHRSSFTSILEDKDFELVMENADAVARRVYREEAKAIEELRKRIIEVSGREEPYDIFICYKETAENGQRTLDSVLAQDLYDVLAEKGYRVFFARITLEDKLGQEYEPYIFAALHSAKIMLAVGTDYEYYNAVWVKNEWSRFLQLIAAGEKKTLIPCYKNIDAYDMPKEFARLQAQDLGKVGATQDLLRGIEKILGKKDTEPAPGRPSAYPANPLVKRGYLYLEDRDYTKATDYFDKALDENPENGEAYLGLVFAELHVQNLEELQGLPISLDSIPNLRKAVRFADGGLKNRLYEIMEGNKAQIGTNNQLVRNILNGTTAELIQLAPALQQAAAGVPEHAWKDVFGVDKSEIDRILAEYEVYAVFEKSAVPMNTSELRAQSNRIAALGDGLLRSVLVDLNHGGYLDFEEKKFSFVSEERRNAKNDEYKSVVQKTMGAFEAKAAGLKQKELELSAQLAEEKKKYAGLEQSYAAAVRQAEQTRQAIAADLEADKARKEGLLGKIRSLDQEQAALGIFQARRKKEITEQISNMKNAVSRLDDAIRTKSTQLAAVGAEGSALGKTEQNIAALEQELREIPAALEQLNNLLAAMEQDIARYTWKPKQIGLDFDETETVTADFVLRVDDVFTIAGRGTVVTGRISVGTVHVNDSVEIVREDGTTRSTTIAGIEMSRKLLNSATVGNNVGLLLSGVLEGQVKHGDTIVKRPGVCSDLDAYILKTFKPKNEKIQAIKYYREKTGAGLAEAKEAVERIFE